MNHLTALFEHLGREFPALVMQLNPAPAHVDAELVIPRQPGLAFQVNLTMQEGDELHLYAGAFHLDWFPSDDAVVVAAYRAAVVGLLSGQYRIVEYYRRGYAVKAQLQVPWDAGGWRTIGTWSGLADLLPWGKRTTRVLQSALGPAGGRCTEPARPGGEPTA